MPDNYSFIGRSYTRGTGNLQLGDSVRVHPIKDIHAASYDGSVIEHKGKVCLDIPGGTFHAELTEKLFSRLEKI